MEDEDTQWNDKYAAWLEEELEEALPKEDEEMQWADREAAWLEEELALEAYINAKQFEHYLNNLMSDMMEDSPFHTRPRPTYRQRVKGTLRVRLQQLRIKVEPGKKMEDPTTPSPEAREHDKNTRTKLPVSKCNKSRVGASFAKRLLSLIRSHLRKKGLG